MSALAKTVLRQLSPPGTPRQSGGNVAHEAAEYRETFGPAGVIQQAKEGFIAARFSPSQPLRIKRTIGLRALQSVSLPEPSDQFYYLMPWEPECLAA